MSSAQEEAKTKTTKKECVLQNKTKNCTLVIIGAGKSLSHSTHLRSGTLKVEESAMLLPGVVGGKELQWLTIENKGGIVLSNLVPHFSQHEVAHKGLIHVALLARVKEDSNLGNGLSTD